MDSVLDLGARADPSFLKLLYKRGFWLHVLISCVCVCAWVHKSEGNLWELPFSLSTIWAPGKGLGWWGLAVRVWAVWLAFCHKNRKKLRHSYTSKAQSLVGSLGQECGLGLVICLTVTGENYAHPEGCDKNYKMSNASFRLSKLQAVDMCVDSHCLPWNKHPFAIFIILSFYSFRSEWP